MIATSLLLTSLMLFAEPETIDVLDLGNGKSQIILTDICGDEHKLILNPKDKKDKALKWLEKLYSDKKINKCIDSV